MGAAHLDPQYPFSINTQIAIFGSSAGAKPINIEWSVSCFLFPLILGIVWSVKNYLTTSCLIFPVAFSCLPSLWSNKYLAILQNEELRFFHKAYNINSESIFEWYFKWSDRYLNYYISINLFVSLLIIILFLHIFFKFSNNSKFLLLENA